jgi:arylsulfatase A-like enzyme
MSTNSIVLITVDCLRADHVGAYGYSRPTTPFIDGLAKDGTIWEYSYANCPGTRWAFQSIHAGVHTHQIDGIGLPGSVDLLAKEFQEIGYNTGAFADNGFLSTDYNYDSGFDDFFGTKYFYDSTDDLIKAGNKIQKILGNKILSKYLLRPSYNLYSKFKNNNRNNGYRPAITDEETVNQAIKWIKRHEDSNDSYFAWIHLMDAHDPYARWDKHLQAIKGDTDIAHVINPGEHVIEGEDPPQSVIDAYDAGIRSADEQVGRILSEVDDDTIIIITGDHGEEFGEYNSFHEASLHQSMTQVPIIARAPNLPNKRISSHWAQHLDIPPTLVDAAGGDCPSSWAGDSLYNPDRDHDEPLFFTLKKDKLGVKKGDYKLLESQGSYELYNSKYGGKDIILNKSEIKNSLKTRLDRFKDQLEQNKEVDACEELGEGDEEISEEVKSSLSDLGYID